MPTQDRLDTAEEVATSADSYSGLAVDWDDAAPRALRREGLIPRLAPLILAVIAGFTVLFAIGVIPTWRVFAIVGGITLATIVAMLTVDWERLPKWLELAPPVIFLIVLVVIREISHGQLANMTVGPLILFGLVAV